MTRVGRGVDGDPRCSRRTFLRMGAAAVAGAGWLSGCTREYGSPTGPTSTDPARLSARPHAPILAPEPGANWLGLGRVRDAILYVPDGYDPSVPAPLLVTLHGRQGGASDWAAFYAKCDLRTMLMLAIDSREVTWDLLSGRFGPDVFFIDQALAYTFDRCVVDPTRLALAGFSDGASYALSLGPRNGDLFTHLIAYSPGFMALPSVPVGSPKVWISHGRSDPIFDEGITFRYIRGGMQDAGYDVSYVAFDGGHEVPAAISNQSLDWFVA